MGYHPLYNGSFKHGFPRAKTPCFGALEENTEEFTWAEISKHTMNQARLAP